MIQIFAIIFGGLIMYTVIIYLILNAFFEKKYQQKITSVETENSELKNQVLKSKQDVSKLAIENTTLRNTNEQLIECTRSNEALIIQRNNQEIQSLKAQIERLNSMHQKEIFDVEWDRDFGGMYHRDF